MCRIRDWQQRHDVGAVAGLPKWINWFLRCGLDGGGELANDEANFAGVEAFAGQMRK